MLPSSLRKNDICGRARLVVVNLLRLVQRTALLFLGSNPRERLLLVLLFPVMLFFSTSKATCTLLTVKYELDIGW